MQVILRGEGRVLLVDLPKVPEVNEEIIISPGQVLFRLGSAVPPSGWAIKITWKTVPDLDSKDIHITCGFKHIELLVAKQAEVKPCTP